MTMEGWIQILNNTITQFGHLLPEEGVENLQRVRDQMEMVELDGKPLSDDKECPLTKTLLTAFPEMAVIFHKSGLCVDEYYKKCCREGRKP